MGIFPGVVSFRRGYFGVDKVKKASPIRRGLYIYSTFNTPNTSLYIPPPALSGSGTKQSPVSRVLNIGVVYSQPNSLGTPSFC